MLLKTNVWMAFKFSDKVYNCVTNHWIYFRRGTTNDANFKAILNLKMAVFVVTQKIKHRFHLN